MKQPWLIILLALTLSANAQQAKLEATLEVSRFQAAEKAYAEFFLYVIGRSVTRDTAWQASLNCTYFIYHDGHLVTGDKYDLVAADAHDFMDVKRQYFAPGKYLIEMELTDNQDSTNTLSLQQSFEIEHSEGVTASDLQLLSQAEPVQDYDIWTRNGVRCIPLPFNYYHKEYDDLVLYMEIYGTDIAQIDAFYVRFSISSPGEQSKVLMQNAKRLKQAATVPVVHRIDLRGLGSGEYLLVADILTRENVLLARKEVGFTRANPEADQLLVEVGNGLFAKSFTKPMPADSVIYALKALAPVVDQAEVEVLNYLIKKGELENQKRFIHNFWVRQNTQDPESEYIAYMEVANAIDRLYHSGLGHGFESDRGHVFLKYGVPDDKVIVEDEPSAPPYEIWIYNYLPMTNQSDVKFLFYDPALSNQFELLHSTADGELFNRRWENILYGDALTETESGDFINATPMADNFHRRAREYFETY